MEKSQKEIKILTKGGKEVTLKFRKIFDWEDEKLARVINDYMPGSLLMWHGDDRIDEEPYSTIFQFLTGEQSAWDYSALFEELDKELEDELIWGNTEFTINGKKYTDLEDWAMDYVDEWLNDNYPKTLAVGNSIRNAIENDEASTWDELRMLEKYYLEDIGWDINHGRTLEPRIIEISKDYTGYWSEPEDMPYLKYKKEGK